MRPRIPTSRVKNSGNVGPVPLYPKLGESNGNKARRRFGLVNLNRATSLHVLLSALDSSKGAFLEWLDCPANWNIRNAHLLAQLARFMSKQSDAIAILTLDHGFLYIRLANTRKFRSLSFNSWWTKFQIGSP